MFNNAKLIINYNDSKTKDLINNVVNVKTVVWKKTQVNKTLTTDYKFLFFKERGMSIIIHGQNISKN